MIDCQALTEQELSTLHGFWSACNYLAAGMIYLKGNPLLKSPLTTQDVKKRLLGHWGASPALSFCYTHMNRLITQQDLNAVFLAGPGHGAPGVLAPTYLEGTYSEVYPDKSQDEAGMTKFFKEFSFPGFIGSHCTPETPGSIHEGGELGYSVSHAYGAVFDNPDLIAVCVVGDGEAETGPLAAAWHSNKFLNPAHDGAVLPILSLNGYKIANPTVLSRIPEDELLALFKGYGYDAIIVAGDEPSAMHQAMANAMGQSISRIKQIQKLAREGSIKRERWPMIILRAPKGWTGPSEVDGHKVAGTWRAHQVPIADIHNNENHLKQLQDWLQSYAPDKLFDTSGKLHDKYLALTPKGAKRMSANPITNGGALTQALNLPNFNDYAVHVSQPGVINQSNTAVLGKLLRDIIQRNPNNFRLFGPDETASNKLDAVFDVTQKVWMAEKLESDSDGANLATSGRVMEILSEHTLEGWIEGYLLTGRHGLFHTYEAFAHVIDSMINQHAKWLDICKHHVPWRAPISSLNLLLSSVVWRQDHNGFSHQDPGFVDLLTNKSADVTRIYFPPDGNCLLSVADHCLRSKDYINLIVADKQKHLQYLSIEEAKLHCAKGIGIWPWASNDHHIDADTPNGLNEPDVIMACCGDIPTMESLAATAILREALPELKVRFINVVDLYKLQSDEEHPHGLSQRDFDTLFTSDKPIIFNFHGYPWLIHKLAYKRSNTSRLHVHGYKEKGNINTPLELAIINQIDRFNLVINVIDRVSSLQSRAAHLRQKMQHEIISHLNYAHEHGVDPEAITEWTWPYN